MKTSKLLAMALAIVMIVSLVPAITPSARAAEGTKILDVDTEYPDEIDKSDETEKRSIIILPFILEIREKSGKTA